MVPDHRANTAGARRHPEGRRTAKPGPREASTDHSGRPRPRRPRVAPPRQQPGTPTVTDGGTEPGHGTAKIQNRPPWHGRHEGQRTRQRMAATSGGPPRLEGRTHEKTAAAGEGEQTTRRNHRGTKKQRRTQTGEQHPAEKPKTPSPEAARPADAPQSPEPEQGEGAPKLDQSPPRRETKGRNEARKPESEDPQTEAPPPDNGDGTGTRPPRQRRKTGEAPEG